MNIKTIINNIFKYIFNNINSTKILLLCILIITLIIFFKLKKLTNEFKSIENRKIEVVIDPSVSISEIIKNRYEDSVYISNVDSAIRVITRN